MVEFFVGGDLCVVLLLVGGVDYDCGCWLDLSQRFWFWGCHYFTIVYFDGEFRVEHRYYVLVKTHF